MVLSGIMSKLKDHVSPRTEDAVKHGRQMEEHLGGKEDDITAIVGQVKLEI